MHHCYYYHFLYYDVHYLSPSHHSLSSFSLFPLELLLHLPLCYHQTLFQSLHQDVPPSFYSYHLLLHHQILYHSHYDELPYLYSLLFVFVHLLAHLHDFYYFHSSCYSHHLISLLSHALEHSLHLYLLLSPVSIRFASERYSYH